MRHLSLSNQNHVSTADFSRGVRADFLPEHLFLSHRDSNLRIHALFRAGLGLVGLFDTGNVTPAHSLAMNAQYFIDKFTAIPDDKWIVGQLCNSQGQCCVLGHCGERRGVYEDTPESHALKMLFHTHFLRPDDINDYGSHEFFLSEERRHKFDQTTPKARILAALEAIKALQ